MRSRKRVRLAALAVAAGVAVAAAPAAPALADTGGSQPQGYSSAADVQIGHALPTIYVGGALGALLGPIINPVMSGVVNPLVSAIANLPQQMIGAIVSGINGSGLVADQPAAEPPPPAVFANCASVNLGGRSCYDIFNLGFGSNAIFGLTSDQTAGWTVTGTGTGADPVMAEAHTSAYKLSVLGMTLLQTSESLAQASCPTVLGQNPTASSELTGVSFLNGLFSVSAVNSQDGLWAITVAGRTFTLINQVNIGNFNGSPVTIKLSGNALMVQLSLSPYDLLNTIGLGAVGTLLKTFAPTADLTLTAFLGPGAVITGPTYASAWGNGLGFDLSGDLSIGIAGLATIGVSIPTGLQMVNGAPTSGNLLALKIAYASCATSSLQPASAIPPGVN